MHIVVVVGTNRKGALSKPLAEVIATNHRDAGATVDIIDLSEMGPEFLLPTSYKEPAQQVTHLVDRFLAADGVHFIVPEYNGSFPGVVKLFIDHLPYPAGFDKRPCAFVGLAAGQFAGLRAVEHLQGVAGYRNALQYPRRVFIASSFQLFDGDPANGVFADEKMSERLQEQCTGFQAFVTHVSD
jgi:NAD(P)H-dependent FMN reductase